MYPIVPVAAIFRRKQVFCRTHSENLRQLYGIKIAAGHAIGEVCSEQDNGVRVVGRSLAVTKLPLRQNRRAPEDRQSRIHRLICRPSRFRSTEPAANRSMTSPSNASCIPSGKNPVGKNGGIKAIGSSLATVLVYRRFVSGQAPCEALADPGTRVVPAGRRLAAMVSIPPLVRDLRADLARRPTMTELFHRGYNPRTLPPEFTTWFDFVAAEGDATALEAECLGRFRDWFVMLATTRMTKSFKMVLLRVLLDRMLLKKDAVFAGMTIPELAAKCREFLVTHEFQKPARGPTSSIYVNLSPPYS